MYIIKHTVYYLFINNKYDNIHVRNTMTRLNSSMTSCFMFMTHILDSIIISIMHVRILTLIITQESISSEVNVTFVTFGRFEGYTNVSYKEYPGGLDNKYYC